MLNDAFLLNLHSDRILLIMYNYNTNSKRLIYLFYWLKVFVGVQMAKRKKTEIPLSVKKAICVAKQTVPSYTLSELRTFVLNNYNFDLGISTIREILKSKDKWMQEENNSNKITRLIKPKFQSVEDALSIWISQMNASNTSLSTELIIAKAKFFAEKLDIQNFNGSIGWFNRFKSRWGLKHIKCHGEANSADPDTINSGLEILRSLILNTDPNSIFNVDETALFWNLIPNSTFSFKN